MKAPLFFFLYAHEFAGDLPEPRVIAAVLVVILYWRFTVALMTSVAEFCHQHGISRGTFYKLLGEGRAPKAVKIGRRTLISSEAAEEWRRRMEQEAAISGRRAV